MKNARQIMREADALDARRQNQILNQVKSIDRLLEGSTYDDEMRVLHEELAAVQAERDDLQRQLEATRSKGVDNG